jgi:hypothetical protein
MDYKQKLMEEKTQLAERIVSLKAFNEGEKFKEKSRHHQSLLRVQYGAMVTYWECLNARYDALPDNPPATTPATSDKDY